MTPKLLSAPNDSPSQLAHEVRHRFGCSAYRPVREIECEYSGGVLTLRGGVSTYFLKQIAQELAGSVVGVTRINNRIVVDYEN